MSVILGSARIDEYGHATGGAAGDQKQTSSPDYSGEVSMQVFYVHSKGWITVRFYSAVHANNFAFSMRRACNNINIGYDQNNRYAILSVGTATTTKTECDCSSLVRQCFKEATGVDPGNFTTEDAVKKLTATGLCYEVGKYYSGMKLYTGDILNTCTKGHIVGVVEGAARTDSSSNNQNGDYYPKYTGTSDSLVDALNSLGIDSSKASRTKIAAANGITNYTGTAAQNEQMLNLLKNGMLKKPGTSSGGNSANGLLYDASIAGFYVVSTEVGSLNMREAPGTKGTKVICSVPKGQTVQNFGYYANAEGFRWLYVSYNGKCGFMSSRYLKKK